MKRNWFMPPLANRFITESYEDAFKNSQIAHRRWFHTWVLKIRDKRIGLVTEERCISVKLPIFGMYYSINVDAERWGQLSFQYRGQRGCFFAPMFPIEESHG